ncbi:alcohol dehydrogenase catalytic domain-containing protein [Micromonospora saelicesensis]|uniref:alcohol dehydrogenase catalytic domain-containing protein n=1 Tax=Micromonospora TaxID=1873 RepID=UPI000DC373E6|nr:MULTISPECIES: zinc-dependent alcohol dehydrogenase [Micromonospora]KAB1927178.1 zinc-dependent alcohol dehydrogenase [Micromonospora noduli]RAO62919.1 alcohol dehydrogenase [Micromonospora saelicesensis]
MRATVVTAFDRPLEMLDLPVPEPGPGEMLVRIEASGLCHTDIHAARGDWPVRPNPPFVPGHEGVGIVERVGPGVTEHAVGDRVALPWLGWACGTCSYCVTGWETLCESQRNTGYSIDGAHAEYAVTAARYAVRVPEGVDPFEAAPLTCAGLTTYKAVKVAGVRPGDRVAIFGIGGLGHLAQQYAQLFGGETVAVDVTAEKLALATALGATHTVNAAQVDPVDAITHLGGADVAIVLAANPTVIEQAHRCLRRGGRLVLVSLPKENTIALPVFETVLKGITVVGSIVGTRADLAEVFRLHAAGRTRVAYEIRKLDDINTAVEDVLAGRVTARLVLQP